MEKYIALLRGINVGGKNKINMQDLKTAFEEHGFSNVATYINSGNILFGSEEVHEKKIKNECESLIESEFHLAIPVNIISFKDLLTALEHVPSWWNRDAESKHNAIFVIPPVTVDEVFQEVGEIKSEYERIGHYGKVIFWSAPIRTFSRTRWSKIAQVSIYESVTIRNANTVMKLSQLVKGAK